MVELFECDIAVLDTGMALYLYLWETTLIERERIGFSPGAEGLLILFNTQLTLNQISRCCPSEPCNLGVIVECSS